jgi:hypothetical protein
MRRITYQLQNEIYRRFLATALHPWRVGYVLSMAGRWDSAIDYLEASTLQETASPAPSCCRQRSARCTHHRTCRRRPTFCSAACGPVLGSPITGLVHPPLRKIPEPGQPERCTSRSDLPHLEPRIPLDADRLETRAFRQRVSLRGQEGDQTFTAGHPPGIPGQKTDWRGHPA